MEMLDLITAILGVPLVAGGLGGAVRWWHLREPPWQGSSGVFTGALVGHYFWVVAGDWLDGFAAASQLDAGAARGAGAFALGIIATWVVQWVIDFGRRRAELKKES